MTMITHRSWPDPISSGPPFSSLSAEPQGAPQTRFTKNPSMTRVRINYDGWLSLPTAVRQKLGLTTVGQLELELADGSIILRPVRSGGAVAAPMPVAAEPSAPATPPAAAAAAPI